MEVHQYTHTERKQRTHYFWEFFMLFLAVTAGFLVENQSKESGVRTAENMRSQSLRREKLCALCFSAVNLK